MTETRLDIADRMSPARVAATLNAAIADCAAAGGGTVVLPAGEYVSGPIELLGHVTLHLEAGAVLRGSPCLDDYGKDDKSGESGRVGLITARGVQDVAITGRGVIDGQGQAFVDVDQPHLGRDYDRRYTRQGEEYMVPASIVHGPFVPGDRPGNLVRFIDCENVYVSGVTIRNSPTWTLALNGCRNASILGVSIDSRASDCRVPNDDGIDLVACRRVRIADCEIETGDDCIAIYGSREVAVTNCTLSACSAAIRIGGHLDGDVRDCTFSNLVITDTNRGISICVRGAGSVSDLLFANLIIRTRLYTGHWWGNGEPIHLSAVRHDREAESLGEIRNIRFQHINASGEAGILLYGSAESVIRDVSLDDVRLTLRPSALDAAFGGNVDLRAVADLSQAIFCHDLAAVYARHIQGLALRNLDLHWDGEMAAFYREGILCEHFEGLQVIDHRGRQAHLDGTDAAVALRHGRDALVRGCRAAEGTGTFLSIKDVGECCIEGNDLTRARAPLRPVGAVALGVGNRLS